VPGHEKDIDGYHPILPEADFAFSWKKLPVFAHLLPVCPAGHTEIWRASGRMAYIKENLKVQPFLQRRV